MRIIVTGSSGLIGRPLVRHLRSEGHEVTQLVRRAPAMPDESTWDPRTGSFDPAVFEGADAIINLAGAGVADKRWTEAYRQEILDSRVTSTETMCRAALGSGNRPVLVNGSAIGFYGATDGNPVDENSPAGTGFLADVVKAWEGATAPAAEAGLKVAYARTGLVVSREGGAWGKMWPIFKLGAGGKLGSGHQYWSFISLRDEVRALAFLAQGTLEGAVNLTAPAPITNAEATAATARHLHRPAVLPVPAFALKAALGGFSSEVLSSQRVLPKRLEEAGFIWLDPTIDAALAAAEMAS